MGRKKAYKIFDIDYLLNQELTEDDLYYIFDTKSLSYSMIVNMFRFTNQEITDEKKIINLCKNDKDWMYKYFWTDKQLKEYENIVKEVYKKIKYYNDREAEEYAQWWITLYGLSNIKMKDKNISKLCE